MQLAECVDVKEKYKNMNAQLLQSSHKTRVYRLQGSFETVIIKIYYQQDDEPRILEDLARDPPKHLVYSIQPSTDVKRFVYGLNLQIAGYVVIPDFGIDLLELFVHDRPTVSRSGVYMQMFEAIEEFHQRVGRPHGDVKLDNYLYCSDTNTIRLIDYQTSAYTDSYRSLHHHQSYNPTFACDFESLGYSVLHTLIGERMWFPEKSPRLISDFKQQFLKAAFTCSEVTAIQKYILYSIQYKQDASITRDMLINCLLLINRPITGSC